MTEELQKLIASLRLGEHEDPTEKVSLLAAALIESAVDADFLLNLLKAPQAPLRLAAIEASRKRHEAEITARLAELVTDPDQRVRVKLAEIFSERSDDLATTSLMKLIEDSEPQVRATALKSTTGQSVFRGLQENALFRDDDWSVKTAALAALDADKNPNVVKPLASALQKDDDFDIRRRCAEMIEQRLRDVPTTVDHLPSEIAVLTGMLSQLKLVGVHRFPQLLGWLESQVSTRPDPEVLARFGTDLTALVENRTLPRAHLFDEACETLLRLLRQNPPRSIALIGDAGVGKSALINELAYRLAEPEYGWRVLRVSPSDFMSGTKYLGEWETKVRDLIQAISKPRRILLYVPKLSDLSAAGVWSKSDSSVATALAPYLDDGSVVVLGESTPEEFERGLGKIPSLRRLFDQVLVAEPDVDHTRRILAAIRDEGGSSISDELLTQILEVSTQFLSHICRPGNAVGLLQAAMKHEKASSSVAFRNVLDSLSRSTGIPADLLDESVPLRQEQARAFFESKVIGQERAVEAIVDLVTLIKAGLTDPHRPFGVFMFAGPTGVGKTELARALAEFIFGDVSRLKRFDMSEFANQEGFTRLIGTPFENGLLTDAVRQHPFSVVLLDEIEKSHLNVFDLCLQIFDAGRLTDGRGRTVDFRRTIIILTTNVGATTGLLGFGAKDATAAGPARDKTSTELSRFFRAEFLNRLDRIIQFEPLSLEVAEQIARKEIQSVLLRSGIKNRELVVEIDPSIVSLIVKEGYSPRFGARPLKRTVEKLLLLPLARSISSGSLPRASIVRLSAHSHRVRLTTTLPPPEKSVAIEPSQSQSTAERVLMDLRTRYQQLDDAIQSMAARRTSLIDETRTSEFSKNKDRRVSVLNDIHNIDQFLSLHEDIGNALRSVGDPRRRDPAASRRDEIARLDQEIDHLAFVSRIQEPTDLGDALVTVSLVNRTGLAQDSVEKIASMYSALATRRRMLPEVLGEIYSSEQDHAYVLVTGLGAYGLLKSESGLHQVTRRYKQRAVRSGRETLRDDRELVRVNVNPAPSEPTTQFSREVKAKVSPLKPVRERLLKAEFAVNLFHQPTLRSLDIWTSGPKETATTRGLLVLAARGDAIADAAEAGVIRQYDFGLAPKVKDLRTGRVTTKVNQVLKGHLDIKL
jgi:ATP-dependent Clp protease ATP-binding subunit ClpC